MSSGAKILSAVEIRKSFKSPGGGMTEVLKGASFDVFENESVSISGESGAGKTTFLNIAAALESPDAGEVHWLGRRIDALSNSAPGRFARGVHGVRVPELLPHSGA